MFEDDFLNYDFEKLDFERQDKVIEKSIEDIKALENFENKESVIESIKDQFFKMRCRLIIQKNVEKIKEKKRSPRRKKN